MIRQTVVTCCKASFWLAAALLCCMTNPLVGNHSRVGDSSDDDLVGDQLSNDQAWVALDSWLESNCSSCHDEETETGFDLDSLSRDLAEPVTLNRWVRVFDRIQHREMPPAEETQPSSESRSEALELLSQRIHAASDQRRQESGRVPSRRLSRHEYEYTLHDLLGIGGPLAKHLPPENDAGLFDGIASRQDTSSIHVHGFLKAAEVALDEAIQLGPKPHMGAREINYFDSKYIEMWVNRPKRNGGGTVFKTDQDVITFRGENYVFRSDANGYRPPLAGRYSVTITAAAHQPRSSISVSLKRQNDQQGDSELVAAWDLAGEDYRTVEATTYLRPDDYIYVSADELEPDPQGHIIYERGIEASEFEGEGVKIRKVMIRGPLESTWPPERTRRLFPGVEWALDKKSRPSSYRPVLSETPQEHLKTCLLAFGQRAFGRELGESELSSLIRLAEPSLEQHGDFVRAARIPLQAMMVSPELLFQSGSPDQLEGIDLAKRLSYFLWRSLPDEELFELGRSGQLNDLTVLREQADRLLADPKHQRFCRVFLDQWLALDQIDATTPDPQLYPEYDDLLRRAMLAETRQFFDHLIQEDLSVGNLIDADFTFLNRKLAEHYGIPNVLGEDVRRVELGEASLRGGILSQAAIAKVTANGTVTSPVKRGNFVLTHLLGQPPQPPPPGVGSIEPDTRGATTIRETLALHQSVPTCAACHQQIDPPGFALECFDPVGNFRTRYRNSKGIRREINVGLRFLHREYELGEVVDASGVTDKGVPFDDFQSYKAQLLESKEQIARHLTSCLTAFATSGEVEFADRSEIEAILNATRNDDFPVRSLLHGVIASPMFRSR